MNEIMLLICAIFCAVSIFKIGQIYGNWEMSRFMEETLDKLRKSK